MKAGKYKIRLYKFVDESGRLVSTQDIDFSIRPLKVVRFYAPKVPGAHGFSKVSFNDDDLLQLLISIFEPYFVNLESYVDDDIDRTKMERIQKRMIELGVRKATKSWIKEDTEVVPKRFWSMDKPEFIENKDMLELARLAFFNQL
jgi:hypothetical protein